VYPALAVADALRKLKDKRDTMKHTGTRVEQEPTTTEPDETAVLYVGAQGEIEESLVPRAGIRLKTIPGGGLHSVGPVKIVRNLSRLTQGFFQAWDIVGDFRPDVLFLTGGYASVPVALATWLRRRPIVVYLPDVEPGLAIKLLSRFATRVAVNVEASRQYFPGGNAKKDSKVIVTGYPLRSELYEVDRPTARAYFGIKPEDKVLLVFGGSRGARTINRALVAILKPVLKLAHVIHISGHLDAEECRAARAALSQKERNRYHLYEYLHEMGQALAAADLVVARAGAGTLGEFPFFSLPAILVPYPFAWRYQKVNADYLASRGAAIRLDDQDMQEQLWPTIAGLLNDPKRLERMSHHAGALAQPEAANRLATLLKQLAHNFKS
jgi:UDP-N-acetylglucosamine--N-acetylmuramyl-(pentapeptide) pyrophosphoryl-undecaprenol N-acetylglucosamine transferase